MSWRDNFTGSEDSFGRPRAEIRQPAQPLDTGEDSGLTPPPARTILATCSERCVPPQLHHRRKGGELNSAPCARERGNVGVTSSKRHALQDLKLDRLRLVHAGDHSFPLPLGIDGISASRILEDIEPLA